MQMPVSKLTERRLTKLIRFMRKLPRSAEKHFNMSTWFSHDGEHGHAGLERGAPLPDCGPLRCRFTMVTHVDAGLKAVIQSCRLIIDAIRAAGPAGVPSGHLYARLMGQLSLEEYERLMEIVKGTGLINEKNHVLTFDEEIIRAGRHEH